MEQLLVAMQAHPGASLSVLGTAVGATRSAIVSRLHKLSRRGTVAKSRDGHWRIATREPEPHPSQPSPG
jgi:DNA-binding IclR family transcriptional regulator